MDLITPDFFGELEWLAPFLDANHPDFEEGAQEKGIREAVLSLPQFPEFAAAFFAQPDLWEETQKYSKARENRLPNMEMSNVKLYKCFASSNFPERNRALPEALKINKPYNLHPEHMPNYPVRKAETYPLGYDETELSMDFIEQNPDYILAMTAIKMCLVDYLYGLKIQTKEIYQSNKNLDYFNNVLYALHGNAADFSFLHDFAPLIANHLRQLPEEERYTERSLRHAFHSVFQRSAFKSVNEGLYRECPFSRALVKIMQIDFANAPDGTLIPVEGQYPGALLVFAQGKATAFRVMMEKETMEKSKAEAETEAASDPTDPAFFPQQTQSPHSGIAPDASEERHKPFSLEF